ncbi:phage tail family protein [Clostridium sp. HBUAS56017]|uniref:phage distal tail protein n=1 Tax=Clostridium sp. HBUAS56017 TaxID=2571128 RepID=UPI0011776239|nr:phage tail family protein [Clostridium sp. HBUAS56017]
MYINGIRIDPNIEEIERIINHADKVNEVDNTSKNLNPYSDTDSYNLGTIQLTLGFNAKTNSELQKLIGSLILSLSNSTLKFDDLDNMNFYTAYSEKKIVNDAMENDLTDGWYETISFNLTILSIYEEEIIHNTRNETSTAITLNSSCDTPCIIEVTPMIDMIDIRIEGLSIDPIIINGLELSKTIIVDGENRKVTLNGANVFSKTDMWQYPKLVPGVNDIKFSREKCNINIRYKPKYI